MEIRETELRDVWLIYPDIKRDFRGEYTMIYIEDWAFGGRTLYPGLNFVEHCISVSHKNVLRGIHYSPNCWKVNQCLKGELYYVVVNCDENDEEFGKWQAFILNDKNRVQVLKHPRYGSASLSLTDNSIFHYIQTQYYNPDNPDQRTFKWDDERFNIYWPVKDPILSERDARGKYVWEVR